MKSSTKKDVLQSLRTRNPEKLIISHLNINSLRNKFEFLIPLVRENIDIMMLSETKLDASFPQAQFQIEGYSRPYRLDRNQNGGGIILYVREDIPSKLLKSTLNSEKYECLLVEINLRKRKWLIICNYNPHKTSITDYLKYVSKEIDFQLSKYENVLLLGDFNS